VFASFLTPYDWTNSLIDVYKRRSAEQNLPAPGPDRFAYLALCHTAETDAQAEAEGQQLLWYLRRKRHPQFNTPPGYVAPRVQAQMMIGGARKGYADSFETLQEKGIVMTGSPDTMIRRIRTLYERCGIGHLLMMNQAGAMPHHQVRRSLELFAREVYPAIRDLGERAEGRPEERLAAPAPAAR
jgi:alkanesulfonate monooxygenase SsuD/methylene tetrahydromethanopterin reductase-like flavin-dependent oxidoreductase (luciferase family)